MYGTGDYILSIVSIFYGTRVLEKGVRSNTFETAEKRYKNRVFYLFLFTRIDSFDNSYKNSIVVYNLN